MKAYDEARSVPGASGVLAACLAAVMLDVPVSAGESALARALDEAKPVSALQFVAGPTVFVPGKGAGSPDESVADLGIALIYAQDNYWTSNRWSAKGYRVTRGKLVDPEGRNEEFAAYRVSPPVFSNDFGFVASGNNLFFRFPETDDYVIYSFRTGTGETSDSGTNGIPFRNGWAVEEARIGRDDVVAGGFTLVPGIDLHHLQENRIYFHVAASRQLAAETAVARGVSVSRLSTNRIARISRFTVDAPVGGVPIHSMESQAGPGNAYPEGQRLFCSPERGGVAVLWKDSTRRRIWLTRLGADLSVRTVRMPVCLDELGAATRDSAGNWYYLTHATGPDPEILLVKTNRDGRPIRKRKLGAAGRRFDVASLDASWNSARLHHAKGRLCLVLARVMHNGHQGSTVTVFRARNLKTVKPPSQNASHSFDSRVTHDGENFLTMSLGDNYPRGVVINKVRDDFNVGRVVFTYRTHHADTQRDLGNGTVLPPNRWSNDNRTYTELGDIVPMDNGHAVLVSSEKSVSNRKTTEAVNQSRNLAYLLVSNRFDGIDQNQLVVPRRMIRTKGRDSRRFAFYNFGGGRVLQQNRGVVWLTHYRKKNRENATRPKMMRWGRDRLLVLWEKWALDHHVSTHGMVIDSMGRKKSGGIRLGPVRFAQGQRLVRSGGRVYGVAANGRGLEVVVIEQP